MKALAVTGFGVVSTIGIGRRAFTDAIRSAVGPGGAAPARGAVLEVSGFDAAKYLGDKGLRSLDRLTKLLVVAARLALHDAGLKRDGVWAASTPERVGIVVSNAYGSLEAITELDRVATLEDARYINPSRFPLTVSNSAAGYVSIWEDLRALNVSVSDGNCGAIDAALCAAVFAEQDRADVLLVGGGEAMSEALALAFGRLGALSEQARLGEGAALLTLETPEAARGRGADALCTIAGCGASFVAPEHDASLLHASSKAVERAIAYALSDAGLLARDVDLVVSGLSGLRPFDEAELSGIDRALGDATCVLAPKVALGETFGAGGALGMAAATALLSDAAIEQRTGDGIVAQNNTSSEALEAGPGQSLVVRGTLRARLRTALVTSIGYYGNASALVMRACPR